MLPQMPCLAACATCTSMRVDDFGTPCLALACSGTPALFSLWILQSLIADVLSFFLGYAQAVLHTKCQAFACMDKYECTWGVFECRFKHVVLVHRIGPLPLLTSIGRTMHVCRHQPV